jgi:hypothetical protein
MDDNNLTDYQKSYYDTKKELDKLKEMVIKLETRDKYEKYVVCILNMHEKGKLGNIITNKEISWLKYNYICQFNYIFDDDSDFIISDKLTDLYYKIKDMDDNVKKIFDRRHKNVLEKIVEFIEPIKTNPTNDILEEIENWWLY